MSIRVYELAKEFGCASKEFVERLKTLRISVKSHMSALDDETAQIIRQELKGQVQKIEKKEVGKKPELKKLQVKIPLSVKELALKLQVNATDIIKKLMKMNVMANVNQNLDDEIVKKLGLEFDYELEKKPSPEEELLAKHNVQDKSNLVNRPPVVTFMGHVDHGKTSLLDVIRKSNLTDKESGGITQHIGAYEVALEKGRITFLDTPGHEAFTAMRARGANVTDIVVLVVAADDGIMPQTIEAIDHAKAAGVPIVVAMNKVDLPTANVDKVKRQLADLGLTSEDWGGKTVTVSVSAKKKIGIEQLLEMIILEAEMLELKADPQKPARGVVVESKLSKGSGPTATILVQNGTLHVGDGFVCGMTYGKVKAMVNDWGKRIEEAGPSSPVEIFGLADVPQVGDAFYVVEDEKKARDLALQKLENLRERKLLPSQRVSLEQLYQRIKEGKLKELKIIIKADVQGSLEALANSLLKLSTKEIELKIIHAQVGGVNESDVMLAAASDAVIIGFNVNIEPEAKEEAQRREIDIRLYRIIYEAINDVRLSMEGLLEPKLKEIFIGRAKILEVFKITKVGKIAGSMVSKGKIIRNTHARLFRGETCLYEGKIDSLKRFKEDVKEVSEGLECGIGLSNFSDFQADDIVECYHIEKIVQRL